MFEVGQLVVCINDDENFCRGQVPVGVVLVPGMDGLRRGVVYTVRVSEVDPDYLEPSVFLEEIIRPRWGGWPESGFNTDRFRPLPSSQISLINSMLVTEPAKENANVR